MQFLTQTKNKMAHFSIYEPICLKFENWGQIYQTLTDAPQKFIPRDLIVAVNKKVESYGAQKSREGLQKS